MKVFSNSSPLMYLSKLGKIELLKMMFTEVIIPKEVFNEVVVKGKNESFLDAFKVERAIKEGWIKVKEVFYKEEADFFREIDEGEAALISLAKKEKADLLLIDDASARTVAESFGLNVKGTLYILLLAYKRRIIDKNELKELIKKLINLGFRLSAEIYTEILEEIEKK